MVPKHGGDRKSEQIKSNNVTLDPADDATTGNSRAYSIDRVKRECEPEALALFREAMVERPGKRAKAEQVIGDNVTNKTSDNRGNTKAYSIDRVKRELITEKPVRGWGEDPKKVEAVIKDDPECLAMFREAMKHQGNHKPKSNEHKCDNVTLMGTGGEGTGNSRAYSIDRVKRECDAEALLANGGNRKTDDAIQPWWHNG